MLNQSDGQGPGGLRQGTKLALIVAAGFLAVAVYYFVSPTNFVGKDGSLFGCGSPISPNTERLGKGQCSIVEGVAMHKALLYLALALLTAGLGYLLFGASSSPRSPRSRDRYEDYDEDDDAVDRRAPKARRPRLGDEDEASQTVRRPRLGDEDEPSATESKVRTRLVEDEPRERRRTHRYDDDAFGSVRD